jgi:hypothetical protein
MALPVVYRRQVGRDLAAAFAHYQAQTEGVGDEFLAAVDSVFDAIERYPEIFSAIHGEVRRAIVSRFPYGTTRDEATVTVAVLAVRVLAERLQNNAPHS